MAGDKSGAAKAVSHEQEQTDPGLVGGARIGKYTVVSSLGRGGMAEILLAVAPGPEGAHKLVVIKRIKRELTAEPQFREMFLDEARLGARLQHPNVIDTYQIGESDDRYFIAMEYLDGQALSEVVAAAQSKEARALDVPSALRIVEGALAGLHYAHQLRDFDGTPLGVIHRDVSPQNLFVTYAGQVKLVDFGIAKTQSNAVHTEVGVLKGKFHYMAPEQARLEPVDHRADIFAMGIVLWELLAGRRMFDGRSAMSVLYAVMDGKLPRLREVAPHVDAALVAIVERALQPSPDARFGSAQEMRLALLHYASAKGHAISQEKLGARIATLFVAEREAMRARIQSTLGADSELADEGPESRSGTRRAATRPSRSRGTAVTVVERVRPHRPRLGRRASTIALAILLAGCCALGASRHRRQGPHVATAPSLCPPPGARDATQR